MQGKYTVTREIKSPVFGIIRRNDVWEQVKILSVTTSHYCITHTVQAPDGSVLTIPHSMLKFGDRRIKRFVRHPDNPKDLI